ncbi:MULTISPECIES: hypothetical protein [unclassified Streptomyces]|uniref:hypothetical protein n=1 Tax=unclassified Streptomyces TaxID=2593676 RepID=UPI0036E2E4E9
MARLPGLNPVKDVEMTVAEGVLTLRAEPSEETKEKCRTEFRYGTFRLPAGAKGDEASDEPTTRPGTGQ